MIGYTIKSESEEGIYYLVRNWEKHRKFWVKREYLNPDMLYKTESAAKASLTKLLKVMDDYKNDRFTPVQFNL